MNAHHSPELWSMLLNEFMFPLLALFSSFYWGSQVGKRHLSKCKLDTEAQPSVALQCADRTSWVSLVLPLLWGPSSHKTLSRTFIIHTWHTTVYCSSYGVFPPTQSLYSPLLAICLTMLQIRKWVKNLGADNWPVVFVIILCNPEQSLAEVNDTTNHDHFSAYVYLFQGHHPECLHCSVRAFSPCTMDKEFCSWLKQKI